MRITGPFARIPNPIETPKMSHPLMPECSQLRMIPRTPTRVKNTISISNMVADTKIVHRRLLITMRGARPAIAGLSGQSWRAMFAVRNKLAAPNIGGTILGQISLIPKTAHPS